MAGSRICIVFSVELDPVANKETIGKGEGEYKCRGEKDEKEGFREKERRGLKKFQTMKKKTVQKLRREA